MSSKVERDAEGGLRLYEVSFCTADAEYEYDIDAATGAVCGVSVERFSQDEAARPGQTLPAAALSREDARRAALADAGLTEAQATVTKLKLDYEDGVRVYEIEFVTDEAEYEYEIDASTGAIREKSVESRGKTRQDSASYIGVDRAKRIALSRAGLSAGDVSFTKAKLEKDDGVRVYEIEFRAGGTGIRIRNRRRDRQGARKQRRNQNLRKARPMTTAATGTTMTTMTTMTIGTTATTTMTTTIGTTTTIKHRSRPRTEPRLSHPPRFYFPKRKKSDFGKWNSPGDYIFISVLRQKSISPEILTVLHPRRRPRGHLYMRRRS